MTLNELLDVIDYNRESETEKLQIVRPDGDWDDVDEVGTSSALLCPFGNAKVQEIGAVCENVIRVSIDWTGLVTLKPKKAIDWAGLFALKSKEVQDEGPDRQTGGGEKDSN